MNQNSKEDIEIQQRRQLSNQQEVHTDSGMHSAEESDDDDSEQEFFDANSDSDNDLDEKVVQQNPNGRQEGGAVRVTPSSSSIAGTLARSWATLGATALGASVLGLPGAILGLGSSMVAGLAADKVTASSKDALVKLNEPLTHVVAASVSLGNSLNPNDQHVFVAITTAFQLIGQLDEEYENNKEETLLSLRQYLDNLSRVLIPHLKTRNLLEFGAPLAPELRDRLGLREGEELSEILTQAIHALDMKVKAFKNDLAHLNQAQLKNRMNGMIEQRLHRIANLTANHNTIPENISRTTNYLNEQIPVISQNIAAATGAHKEFCHTTKSWVSGLQENAYFAVIVGITCLTTSIIQIARFARRFKSNTGPGYAAFFSVLCLTLFLLVTTVAFTSNTRNAEKKRRAEREEVNGVLQLKELTQEEKKSFQVNAAKREFLMWSTFLGIILTAMLGIEVNSSIDIYVSVYAILFCSSIIFCMTMPLLHGLCGRKLFKEDINPEPIYHQVGRVVENGYLVVLGSVEKVLTTEDKSVG